MKKNRERAFNALLNIALLTLVLVIGLWIAPAFLGNMNEAYRNTFYGFRPYIVLTDSMYPAIRPGALLIGRVTNFEDLQVGDIITFEMPDGMLNTHRVEVIDEAFGLITTRGDNADASDAMPVTAMNFRYRVIFTWNGAADLGDLRSLLLFVAAPVGGGLVIAGIIVGIVFAVRRRKRRAPQQLPEYPQPEQAYLPPPQEYSPPAEQAYAPPAEQAYAPSPPPPPPEPAYVPPPSPEPVYVPVPEQSYVYPYDYIPGQVIAPQMIVPLPEHRPPIEIDEDYTLLGLVEMTLNPDQERVLDEEDIDLLILLDVTEALRGAYPKRKLNKEDHEWFDQMLIQRGITPNRSW